MALFGIKLWKVKKINYSSHAFAEKFVLVGKFDNAKFTLKELRKLQKIRF